jgi:heterodisulfide reductase subunit A
MHKPASEQPILVVGAGVAGMQAALDLANLGLAVHLVERETHLGGKVLRLDKVYPTDHCAFCPTWTHAAACREHPRITVSTGTCFKGLEEEADGKIALLEKAGRFIDREKCVFCGKCLEVCPREAILAKAPGVPWDPASPPVPYVESGRCDSCGKCIAACPVDAVDCAPKAETVRMAVSDCVFAVGFEEPSPAPAPEFGGHSHPDIVTAMIFEAWIAEYNGKAAERLLCPSDKRPAGSVAFVQCAGARDKRYLAHCSAVCCMHAAKQAGWLKRRQPELDLTVFYTDLRAPGKGQEAYMREAAKLGVRFIRRRPGLAAPRENTKGIILRHEGKNGVQTVLADIVVLNGGLSCSPYPAGGSKTQNAGHACGFCAEPADIAHSVIQAGNAAFLTYLGLTSNTADIPPSTLRLGTRQ